MSSVYFILFFFFNDTATPEIYTLPLHDALPIYVKTGAALDHRRWLAGIKAGRTFVTNAPLLEFTIAGHDIGDEIRLPAGARLTARVSLRSSIPVDHLEIVGNGGDGAAHPPSGKGRGRGRERDENSGGCVS